jgi:hypothetical protein
LIFDLVCFSINSVMIFQGSKVGVTMQLKENICPSYWVCIGLHIKPTWLRRFYLNYPSLQKMICSCNKSINIQKNLNGSNGENWPSSWNKRHFKFCEMLKHDGFPCCLFPKNLNRVQVTSCAYVWWTHNQWFCWYNQGLWSVDE